MSIDNDGFKAARDFQKLGAPEQRAILGLMDEMKRGVRLTRDEWTQRGLELVEKYRAEGNQAVAVV